MKVDVGDFYGNISKKFKFGWNQTKISTTLHENIITFYCCRRCIFNMETLLWNNRIFLYGYWHFWSTIHKERIVAFPLPHWLRERVTILRYTCVACLCSVHVFVLFLYGLTLLSVAWNGCMIYDLWTVNWIRSGKELSRWPCSLRPPDCWCRVFESRRGHGCLSLVFVVWCVGSELIIRPEESFRVYDCV